MKETTKLKLLHIFFPNKCPCCKRVIPPLDLFCNECFEKFETVSGERCKICFNLKEKCDCKKYPRFYFRSVAPFAYKAPLKNAIIHLKSVNDKRLVEFFVKYMLDIIAKKYKNVQFDAIIPVPMHKSKRRLRGFNQSELLCFELSKQLNVPVLDKALVQKENTQSQHTLNFKQRRQNVKNVYKANPIPIEIQRVLLVDDVITSSATINECAKVLRIEGVSKIYCVSIARTE